MAENSRAGMMSVLATGLTEGLEGLETRHEAQAAQKAGQEKLKTYQYREDNNVLEQELQQAQAELRENTNKFTKQATFRGLKYHSRDGNTKHLNTMLKDESFKDSGIVRFSKLSGDVDSALISQAGLLPKAFLGDPVIDEKFKELIKDKNSGRYEGNPLPTHARYVKAVMADGTEKVIDLFKVKQMLGYFKDASDQEMERALQDAEISEKLNDSKSWDDYGEWGKKVGLLNALGIATPQEAASALYKDMKQGNTAGNIEAAEQRQKDLDTKFEGNFRTNFDPNNEEHRRLAEDDVEAIEQFRGITWSATELSDVQDMASLISLGDPTKTLTDEETGLYDNTLFNVKKYFSDEPGSGGNEAYAAFRNSLRNALFGSALTEHEIAAFNEQLGTLKMQKGPLIAQMVQSLEQVQAKLNVIYGMQNSYVSTYRLGLNREKLAKSIAALKKNVEYYKRLDQGLPARDPSKTDEQNKKDAYKRIEEQL